MPKVTIVLMGVCAMAPGPPEDGAAVSEGPFRVTMPVSSRRLNARSRRTGTREYIPTHVPFVIAKRPPEKVSAANVGNRPPDAPGAPADSESQKSAEHSMAVWLPIRERLKICPDGEYEPGNIRYMTTGESSVHNLADMRRIWADRAALIETCDPLTPIENADARVLTQVLIPSGEVAAISPDDYEWEFRPAKPRTKGKCCYKPLMRHATVTFDVQQYLWISSQSLDNGDVLDAIQIPVPADTTIYIGNSDFEEIFHQATRGELVIDQSEANYDPADSDFELHYMLLKNAVNTSPDDEFLPIPFRADNKAKRFDSRGWVKNCLVAFVQS
jgi:hypothetical protein